MNGAAAPTASSHSAVGVNHHYDVLMDQGYVIIPDLESKADIDLLGDDLSACFVQTPFCQGSFYGGQTKRFGSLLTRSHQSARFVQNQIILDIVRKILLPFADTIALNLTQAIEIHPGAPGQPPHRDENMWGGEKGKIEYLVNVMWPISRFEKANGATVLWPHSHGDASQSGQPDDDPVVAEMSPGSALVFLGSTLHGGGANISAMVRRGVIISYCLGWLKPFENQWLCYPPAVARHFAPALADLVGYHIHRPNLGNYEGQSPTILFDDDRPEYLPAVDALTPEQNQFLEAFEDARLATAA